MGFPPNVMLMSHMEETKVVFQKGTTSIQEILLIEIKTYFDQRCLGMDYFFATQQVLSWMDVLQKYLMNILVDYITGDIRGEGDGSGFYSGSLGVKEDEYDASET